MLFPIIKMALVTKNQISLCFVIGLILITHQIFARSEEAKFIHLLEEAKSGGKVHLVSELTRDSKRVQVNEFLEDKAKKFTPSEIRRSKIPLVLDLSINTNKMKSLKSFKSQSLGKRYVLNALDDWNETPHELLLANERTFILKKGSQYLSLKRLHDLDSEQCLIMCYNMEDWDSISAQQVCQSYSYCSQERQCVLAIRTDKNHTKSILDLVDEGDIVLSIEKADDLLRDDEHCFVASRTYLSTDFEGPLELPVNVYGERSLINPPSDREEPEETGFEWMMAYWEDSDAFMADSQSECAKQCLDTNRQAKFSCLAFDHCHFKMPAVTYSSGLRIKPRNGQSCYLFLLKSDWNKSVAFFRNELIRSTGRGAKKSEDSKKDKAIAHCQRHLLSHLSEFSNFKKQKLNETFKSNRLQMAEVELKDTDLASCAFECSNKLGDCLLFEYCSSFDKDSKSSSKTCSLFNLKPSSKQRQQQELLATDSESRTSFNSDCHIYLKGSQFKSIGDLLEAHLELEKRHPRKDLLEESYGLLIIGFLSLYLLMTALIYVYIKKGQTAQPPLTRLEEEEEEAENPAVINLTAEDSNNLELRLRQKEWHDVKI